MVAFCGLFFPLLGANGWIPGGLTPARKVVKRTGLMPSDSPRLFGEVALERKYVTVSQLYEALTLQARAEVRNEPYQFLGEILSDLGYMKETEVLEILNEIHAEERVYGL